MIYEGVISLCMISWFAFSQFGDKLLIIRIERVIDFLIFLNMFPVNGYFLIYVALKISLFEIPYRLCKYRRKVGGKQCIEYISLGVPRRKN